MMTMMVVTTIMMNGTRTKNQQVKGVRDEMRYKIPIAIEREREREREELKRTTTKRRERGENGKIETHYRL